MTSKLTILEALTANLPTAKTYLTSKETLLGQWLPNIFCGVTEAIYAKTDIERKWRESERENVSMQ